MLITILITFTIKQTVTNVTTSRNYLTRMEYYGIIFIYNKGVYNETI